MNRSVKHKLIFIALFAFVKLFAQSNEGENRVPLHFDNQPLAGVLDKIQREFEVSFVYDDNLVKGIQISCASEEPDIESALKRLFKDKPIGYKIYNQSTVVLYKSKAKKTKSLPLITKKEGVPKTCANEFKNVKLLTKAEPVYPPLAVQCGVEGKVTVKIFVSENGNVIKTAVKKSSGSRILDSAAIAYSKKLKFKPAVKNGKPVRSWTKMDYEFSIVEK